MRPDTEAVEARAAHWIARRDAGGWTTDDQHALDAWLDESVANRVSYLRLHTAWQQADALRNAARPELLASVARRAPPVSQWRVAASVLLCAAAAVLVASFSGGDEAALHQTALGVSRSVALADGSILTLNSATRLRARVDGRVREVRLEAGEAFFDVAHKPGHNFVVEAGARRVSVLGTRFSVRRDGDAVSVTVQDGRVRLEHPFAAAATLGPGDVASATDGALVVTRRTPAQVSDALSWRQGQLVFDDMTLSAAAAEFNRYNELKLVVADEVVGRVRIGGRFDTRNVEAFARLLEQGFGVEVRQEPGRIVLFAARTGF